VVSEEGASRAGGGAGEPNLPPADILAGSVGFSMHPAFNGRQVRQNGGAGDMILSADEWLFNMEVVTASGTDQHTD
ncbi:hypothetical protein AAER89_29760, partial [Klebsiella pneumoniae]|uniref:hypothetical protein n=1 Tax=Klebsiella pneumoniae TaxID=573 RepID=UPI0031349333